MNNLVLVLNSGGIVGSHFVEHSSYRKSLREPSTVELNMVNKDELTALFNSYEFVTVINFLDDSNIWEVEKERGNKTNEFWKIRVDGVKNLCELMASFKNKIHYIHFSSRFVFSGDNKDKGPYNERHPLEEDADLITWYGCVLTKSEEIVSDILADRTTILRIDYPVAAKSDREDDFFRKIINDYDNNTLKPLFSDQYISLSYVDEITAVVDIIVRKNIFGVYHVASTDTSTPYDLGKYLLEKNRDSTKLKSSSLKDFFWENDVKHYLYPKYGGLKVEDTQKKLGFRFSSCREVVDKLVGQGLGK